MKTDNCTICDKNVPDVAFSFSSGYNGRRYRSAICNKCKYEKYVGRKPIKARAPYKKKEYVPNKVRIKREIDNYFKESYNG